MISDLLVPFKTAYRRPYVPKGCRAVRFEFPLVQSGAMVQRIERSDASIAFRIVYPSEATAQRTVELLAFGGKIWWPDRDSEFIDPPSCDDWREWIGEQHDLLRIIPDGVGPVKVETASRVDLLDDRGEVTAQVQRRLSENFIVCEGEVYASGGPPLHALCRHPRSSRVAVVSAGVDRDIGDFKPLFGYPSSFARHECQLALAHGNFWVPGSLVAADLPPSLRSFPEIQVLVPEFIPADLADRTQIDALFRMTMRSLDWHLFYTVAPGTEDRYHREAHGPRNQFDLQVRAAYDAAVEPVADDIVTSERRLRALRALFSAARNFPKKHHRAIEALEHSFRQLDRRNPVAVYTPEDIEALARLSG